MSLSLILVEVLHVDNPALVLQQRVEEREKHRSRHFLSEDALETFVGERIDKLSHNLLFY